MINDKQLMIGSDEYRIYYWHYEMKVTSHYQHIAAAVLSVHMSNVHLKSPPESR